MLIELLKPWRNFGKSQLLDLDQGLALTLLNQKVAKRSFKDASTLIIDAGGVATQPTTSKIDLEGVGTDETSKTVKSIVKAPTHPPQNKMVTKRQAATK